MRVPTRSPTQRRLVDRARVIRLAPRPATEAPAPAEVPERRISDRGHHGADERRAREAGGPIDRAEYVCGCGYVFDAAVSTSVTCPRCGGHQAW